MTAQRTKYGLALGAAAVAAFLVSGCTASSGPTPTPSGPASDAAAPPSSSTATASAGTDASTPTPTSTPDAVPAGTPPCRAGSLTASTDPAGGGAAGNVSMQLILTNSGTAPCVLRGFAAVSLAAGPDGEPIGAPATRDYSAPGAEVLLAPGRQGTATLQYSQAGNYPDCSRTPAAGFRVYPPDDTASLFIAEPRDACANPNIALLTTESFQAR